MPRNFVGLHTYNWKQDQVNDANTAFILISRLTSQGFQSASIGPGGPSGPGGPDGLGGQGCLGGQGGPGNQVCQCIWFTWSKQSNYLQNLRCHACDTLTH